MSAVENPLIGIYRACGTIGNVGMPGAPIAHFALLVTPSQGTVAGTVFITQAIAGPESAIPVNVQGTISELVWGSQESKVVHLTGTYSQSLTPPAIGTIQEKFSAYMVVSPEWNGQGGFAYGQQRITNVPVKSIEC